MEDRVGNKNLSLQIYVSDSTVTLTFSENENVGLKELVRDILTEAYEERLQDGVLPGIR